MGGILSGIALHKGLIPYGGTFLVFADYMRPSIRLAGIMKQHVIYVFTHDSVAVGEDGPTHQPVEHLASLRAIPNLVVIRPADAPETVDAWRYAITCPDGPVALILSRQKLPVLDRLDPQLSGDLSKGGYIFSDSEGSPDIIIIATGSELNIAVEAGGKLKEKGISARIVNMPSIELFEKNSPEYKDKVLLPDVKTRLVVEAGLPMGWEKYAGEKGAIIGMTTFGASAPGGVLMEKFGFTSDNIFKKAMELLNR